MKEKKSSFKRNVFILTIGTASAQIINFIMTPLVTRLFTPQEYGLISVYTAVLLTFSFFGSLNYEKGIPIAKDNKSAVEIVLLSFIVLAIVTVLSFALFFLSGSFILNVLNGETLEKYKYLIPIGIFLSGVYNILNEWALRSKEFNNITITKITQTLSQNVISIFSGIIGTGPIGLIIGRILGQSMGITTLSKSLFKYIKTINYRIDLNEIKKNAIRYKNFPLFTLPRRFLGDITLSMPILFITSLYGSSAVGLFGLANSVVQLPMNIIGNSISNVFYAECAKLRHTNPEKIIKLSNKLLLVLILIGLIPISILIFKGEMLFSIVFGNEWMEAGKFASILAISIYFKFIFTPISSIFDIYEKQEMGLVINIVKIIIVFFVFIISKYLELDIYYSIGLYSLSMSAVYFVQFLFAQKIIKNGVDIN